MPKKESSKKKKTKIIPLLLLLVLIIFILIISIKFFTKPQTTKTPKPETNTIEKKNTNEKVVEDKIVNNLKFTNINCVYDGNYSIITYKIINTGTTTIKLSEYELIVKDKDNNIITNIMPDIDKELKPNEEYETGNTINMDLSKAYSIEVSIDN